jgi:hypothetical protein
MQRRAPNGLRACAVLWGVALASCRGACGSPGSSTSTTSTATSASAAVAADGGAVAEVLPRCRADAASIAIPGEDVIVGEAVTTDKALLVAAVRRAGAKRVLSIVEAPLDLGSIRTIDAGLALGDDPPPALRVHGGVTYAAFFARREKVDAGGPSPQLGAPGVTRELQIAKVENGAVSAPIGSVHQHADESMAYDVAWSGDGAMPLVAWDEDAPPREGRLDSERGLVKVQVLGAPNARAVSPETSDAESPRLLARPGGFWLAWLARKPEKHVDPSAPADASAEAGAARSLEGPGEHRTYRWVEIVALDAKGEPTSPVRRASPTNGHVVAFEILHGAGGDAQILVQDEAARAEGSGGRIVQYAMTGDRGDAGTDLVDGGVGRALAELALGREDGGAPRWLAWTDAQERAHVAPVASSPAIAVAAHASAEPALEGARLLATHGADVVYAAHFGPSGASLRRFTCR